MGDNCCTAHTVTSMVSRCATQMSGLLAHGVGNALQTGKYTITIHTHMYCCKGAVVVDDAQLILRETYDLIDYVTRMVAQLLCCIEDLVRAPLTPPSHQPGWYARVGSPTCALVCKHIPNM